VDGAADVEPMPGRKMKGYAILTDPIRRERKELKRWIERSNVRWYLLLGLFALVAGKLVKRSQSA
jgi:hypothetical protein